MALTAAPYGLKPVKRSDGMPYAGATSQYLIDPAGEATNLFYGQVVIIGADGYIALSTATGADITTNNLGGSGLGAIGVFVGCQASWFRHNTTQRVHLMAMLSKHTLLMIQMYFSKYKRMVLWISLILVRILSSRQFSLLQLVLLLQATLQLRLSQQL